MRNEGVPLRRETFRTLHRRHNLWRWLFSTLLSALFVCFVCFIWFGWARIGNDSMAPTLRRDDLVLVDRLYKYCREIERTDIVAFYRPGTRELLIKRVVATGGESVSGRSGALWIDEKYSLDEREYRVGSTDDFDTVMVPEGSAGGSYSANAASPMDAQALACVVPQHSPSLRMRPARKVASSAAATSYPFGSHFMRMLRTMPAREVVSVIPASSEVL